MTGRSTVLNILLKSASEKYTTDVTKTGVEFACLPSYHLLIYQQAFIGPLLCPKTLFLGFENPAMKETQYVFPLLEKEPARLESLLLSHVTNKTY